MRRTYLLGNGLSLGFNPEHYSLANLTNRVRHRLEGMTAEGGSLLEHLDGIGESLRPDFLPATRATFEDIAGPVDRLANTLSEFGPLDRVATDDQRGVLRELQRKLRALYTRVVGAVLEEVVQHPTGPDGWTPVNEVAAHLARTAVNEGELDVFCLNYDALLDSALLEALTGELGERVALSDEFRGWPEYTVSIYTAARQIADIPALRWRGDPYVPPKAHLRLHHLHGAGTWMKFRDEIWKAKSLDEIREHGLFTAWAEGIERPGETGAVEPVVLLGDQKGASVQRAPFNENYVAFASAVGRADEIVLAGFSFTDRPLNRTITTYRQKASRIVVVNPSNGIEARAREALALALDDPLVVVNEPLPAGFMDLE